MGLIHHSQQWLKNHGWVLPKADWQNLDGGHCSFFEWYWLCLNVAALFVDLFVGLLLCVCDPDGAAPVTHVHSSSVPSAPCATCATATRPAATQNYQPPWCLKPNCHNKGRVNFWYFRFHVLKFVLSPGRYRNICFKRRIQWVHIRGCIPDQYQMVPAGTRPVGPSLNKYFETMFGFDLDSLSL